VDRSAHLPAIATEPAGSLASASTQPTISRRRAWLLAARPKTLPAAVAPVVVGTAVALREGGFDVLATLACVAVALLLQVAANFANDAFDFHRGADTAERLGPLRVTAAGLIPSRQVMLATAATLALAMLVGVYLVWLGGWPILAVGLLAVVSAVAYTGGPAPLGYAGLGDVFVFLFFGLVAVAGTAFVQTGELTTLSILAGVPIGCLATAILVINNLRDVETDQRAGKRTLAVRLGPNGAIAEYIVLMTVAFLMPVLLYALGELGLWAFVPWVLIPLTIVMIRGVMEETGRQLNARLAGTARLELLFALFLAVAIVR
jgi:1,4-dihydroxy-2-naphthoate octaprenyltransferase